MRKAATKKVKATADSEVYNLKHYFCFHKKSIINILLFFKYPEKDAG